MRVADIRLRLCIFTHVFKKASILANTRVAYLEDQACLGHDRVKFTSLLGSVVITYDGKRNTIAVADAENPCGARSVRPVHVAEGYNPKKLYKSSTHSASPFLHCMINPLSFPLLSGGRRCQEPSFSSARELHR